MTTNDERYYRHILGLPKHGALNDAKKRYRELIAQYRPDMLRQLDHKLKTEADKELEEIERAYSFFKTRYKSD